MFYVVDIAFEFVGELVDKPTSDRIYLFQTNFIGEPATSNPAHTLGKCGEKIVFAIKHEKRNTRTIVPSLIDMGAQYPSSESCYQTDLQGLTYIIKGYNGIIDIIRWTASLLMHKYPHQGHFLVNAFPHKTLPNEIKIGEIDGQYACDHLQNYDGVVISVERAKRGCTFSEMISNDNGEWEIRDNSQRWICIMVSRIMYIIKNLYCEITTNQSQ